MGRREAASDTALASTTCWRHCVKVLPSSWRNRRATVRGLVLAADSAHSSIHAMAKVIDVDLRFVPVDDRFEAAHLGTMGNLGGVSGPVSSESAGGLSVSYAVWMTNSLLASTSYGRAYLATLSSVVFGPQVT